MRLRPLISTLAIAAAPFVPCASAQQEHVMHPSDYVVMPHQKGSLALQVSSITGLWYLPAADGKAAQLRVLAPALGDAKTLAGADAEALWGTLHARGDAFLFVSHMGGTLGIPRAQVRAAYYATDSGSPRLRLTYDGDPNGKTLEGDEATTVWSDLSH
jgi:hypothetical protein